jgi:hypothetical protein
MDFGLKFEFARYLAVYRGIPRHTALPLPGGKNVAVGKKTLAGGSGGGGGDNRNRRGERFDPLTTTLLSTLLPRTVSMTPRNLFRIPCLTLACSHRQDGCTNGKIPIFTLCYFSNGSQQPRGRAKLGKSTRLSCFECKV